MPTHGPTEVIELAVLNYLHVQQPKETEIDTSLIMDQLENLDRNPQGNVPIVDLKLIPEIIVGLVQREQVKVDEGIQESFPKLNTTSFRSGNEILDRLKLHLLADGRIRVSISLDGLERRDALLG